MVVMVRIYNGFSLQQACLKAFAHQHEANGNFGLQ